MADDDTVVFQNSALYEHLKEIGYTDEDVKPETFQSFNSSTQSQWEFFNEKRSDYEKPTFWTKLKNSFDKAFWDDDWTDQLTQVHSKYADELTDGIMESPVLEEEDGTYIESFFFSMQSYRPEASKGETTIMGTMLMQLAILGASLAYAGFRMIYLKSPDITSRVYVWSIDVIAVLLTIAALTPITVKSASAGRIVSKLKTFSVTCKKFLRQIHEFHKLLSKSVRLLHELELVARGFTVVSPLTPIIKTGAGKQSYHQCPKLRRSTFLTARDVMLSTKFAAQALLCSFPSHVEIEGLSSYLANQPLSMYGPCVTTEQEDKLRVLTDDYSLNAVKAMVKLCNVHLSEFLRVLAMSVLTSAEEHNRNPSFGQQEEVIKKLKDKIESHIKPVSKLYTLHKCLYSCSGNTKTKSRQPLKQTPSQSLYTVIHSLSLHLQAAQYRVHQAEEKLEKIIEEQEEHEQQVPDLPPELLGQITSDLKVIQVDLNACQDCLQESENRVAKYSGKNRSPPTEHVDQTLPKKTNAEKQADPIPLFEIGDPVIQDQVFEAYVDPDESNTSHSNGDCLSEEEKAKIKEEKQAAIHLLRELKSVIAIRAIEREERERRAFQSQYPDNKFYDPLPTLRQTKESEKNDSSGSSTPSETQATDQTCDAESNELTDFENTHENHIQVHTEPSDCPSQDDISVELRKKLAGLGGEDFQFSSAIAAMAAARSHQMAALSEDTFGDLDIIDDCDKADGVDESGNMLQPDDVQATKEEGNARKDLENAPK